MGRYGLVGTNKGLVFERSHERPLVVSAATVPRQHRQNELWRTFPTATLGLRGPGRLGDAALCLEIAGAKGTGPNYWPRRQLVTRDSK